MKPDIRFGDILDQDVEVIVNAWNRNIIPWWLLLPQGVSGAIKKKGGYAPFRDVARFGPIPLGEARLTGAGTLPFKAIIHVAGINMFWCATKSSVTNSVINAMRLVNENGYKSVAFPLIGAGSGNRGEQWSLDLMNHAFEQVESDAKVFIVRYKKGH
ncbi:MAG: macro domain-containing protein [Gammaproteobacteria bacterium]|nr:macro domain-containing protein [Gammaproteobacteria bacterium]